MVLPECLPTCVPVHPAHLELPGATVAVGLTVRWAEGWEGPTPPSELVTRAIQATPEPWVFHGLHDNGSGSFCPHFFLREGSKPVLEASLLRCPHPPIPGARVPGPSLSTQPNLERTPPGPPPSIGVNGTASRRQKGVCPPAPGAGKLHCRTGRPPPRVPRGESLPSLGLWVPISG